MPCKTCKRPLFKAEYRTGICWPCFQYGEKFLRWLRHATRI